VASTGRGMFQLALTRTPYFASSNGLRQRRDFPHPPLRELRLIVCEPAW